MTPEQCPVCGTDCEIGLKNSGDFTQIRCKRCGPYIVTGTAKAILPGRLSNGEDAFVRLSHGIRLRTTEENWYELNSSNIDELVTQPLPAAKFQRTRFLVWLKSQLLGDDLGEVVITSENTPSILGFVGAKKMDGIQYLIKDLELDGLIECVSKTFSGQTIRITNNGHEFLNFDERPIEEEQVTVERHPEQIRSDCPECGSDRNAYVLATADVADSDGEVRWSETFYVVKCAGCETLNVKNDYWFSEWDFIDDDPRTGKPRMNHGVKTSYFKPIQSRKKPDIFDRLEDEVLSNILNETYKSFELGFLFLASVGSRAAIDRIMVLKVGDVGNFPQKLLKMKHEGLIAETEKEILETMIDVGSASTHRGHTPSKKTLNRVLDTIEGLLNRFFVVSESLAEIKRETPNR